MRYAAIMLVCALAACSNDKSSQADANAAIDDGTGGDDADNGQVDAASGDAPPAGSAGPKALLQQENFKFCPALPRLRGQGEPGSSLDLGGLAPWRFKIRLPADVTPRR